MTQDVVFDFSERPPASLIPDMAREGRGANVYDGAFYPGDQWVHDAVASGLGIAFIHEEYGTESFEGFGRGARAGEWANAHVLPGYLCYFNAGDTPDVAGHTSYISDFFAGVASTYRDPIIGAYGSLDALLAAMLGSSKVQRLWGVETWIPGATGNADHNVALWAVRGVHLVQMANVPSPVDGTDVNRILSGAWNTMGASSSTPTLTRKKVQSKMWLAYIGPELDWCDVWYNGVLVDGFKNDVGKNAYNVGTQFQHYIDQGVPWTAFPDEAAYNGARARLLEAAKA